jgi:hypothetical protein
MQLLHRKQVLRQRRPLRYLSGSQRSILLSLTFVTCLLNSTIYGRRIMSTKSLKKAAVPSAYPAASGLFEQLAGLFASHSPGSQLKLQTSQSDALLKALRHAPVDEVAAVSQVLQQLSAYLKPLALTLSNSVGLGAHPDFAASARPLRTGGV